MFNAKLKVSLSHSSRWASHPRSTPSAPTTEHTWASVAPSLSSSSSTCPTFLIIVSTHPTTSLHPCSSKLITVRPRLCCAMNSGYTACFWYWFLGCSYFSWICWSSEDWLCRSGEWRRRVSSQWPYSHWYLRTYQDFRLSYPNFLVNGKTKSDLLSSEIKWYVECTARICILTSELHYRYQKV